MHHRTVESMPEEPGTAWPPILYHYTDAAGLVGILKPPSWPKSVESPPSVGAAQLWASDIRYMNDFRELRHGAKLLRKRIRAEAATQGEDEISPLLRHLADYLDAGVFDSVARHLRIFATCFCANGDLLSQWRGYAGGVGGYAIGFRTDVLRHYAEVIPHDPDAQPRYGFPAQLRRVAYRRKEKVPIMDAVVAGLQSAWDEGFLTTTANSASLEFVSGLVYGAVARLKHKAFREEREFRLFTQLEVGQPVAVRASGSRLVPYMHLGINLPADDGGQESKPVSEVVVGPGGDHKEKVAVVRNLLQISGFGEAKVRPSKIPFRG